MSSSTAPGSEAGTGARVSRGTARDAVDAQHARFGGIKWGAAFFGWLSANGLAVLLIALVAAGGVAVGLTQGVGTDTAVDEAAAIGLANRCVPDSQLEAAVDDTATAIAANSWFTSRTDKMLVDGGEGLSLGDGLAFEATHSPGAGPDMVERLTGGFGR